jgi:hypothetical protein
MQNFIDCAFRNENAPITQTRMRGFGNGSINSRNQNSRGGWLHKSLVPGTVPTPHPGCSRRRESQPSSQYEQREANDRSE